MVRAKFDTRITRLFGIDVPIIQGAMAWLSEAELVAAVSNEGGLGVLGASIMPVEEFEQQVVRTRQLTDRPFGVNFPLVLGDYSPHLEMVLGHGVKSLLKGWAYGLHVGEGAAVSHLVEHREGDAATNWVSSGREPCGDLFILRAGLFDAASHFGGKDDGSHWE